MSSEATVLTKECLYSSWESSLNPSNQFVNCWWCKKFKPTRYCNDSRYICEECDKKEGHPFGFGISPIQSKHQP